MKTGRNAPCPCGSGAKFKKCCLDASRSVPTDAPTQGPAGLAAATLGGPFLGSPSFAGLTPYTVAKIAEDQRHLDDANLAELVRRHLRDHWTLGKVAALATEAIEAQLRAYGVAYSRERFVALTAGRASAWTIANVWQRQNILNCKGKETDFLGLAACELWKRLNPEPASVEMLDDWMQDGYRLQTDGRVVEACDLWWRVWRSLLPRFVPAIDTMEAANVVFTGSQMIFNWAQDFADCLVKAVSDEPRLASRGAQYCQEWLAQFTGEGATTAANFRYELARFLFHMDESAEAEVALDGILARWPDDVWSYVRVADAVGGFDAMPGLARDLVRARTVLEAGLARLPANAPDRDLLEERLAGIERTQAA